MTDGWRPVLARLASSLPQGRDWVYEPKWDGFRGLLVRRQGNARILSRNRRALEPYFSELTAAALESLPEDFALDGELLALRDGRPDFPSLLLRLGRRLHPEVRFVAFDLLRLDGEDLCALPLSQRRSRLLSVVAEDGDPICASVQTELASVAEAWLEQSAELHLEGVVAKRASQPYRHGKRSWVKVKHWQTTHLVVGGVVGTPEPTSLLLGAYDGVGSLTYVGQTTAFSAEVGVGLAAALQTLACERSFGDGPVPGYSRWDSHRFETWLPLRPVLVCEVSFSRLDGHFMRHSARFLRWRPDKSPQECTLAALTRSAGEELAGIAPGRGK
jgi:ATP-dependent DNA ligase